MSLYKLAVDLVGMTIITAISLASLAEFYYYFTHDALYYHAKAIALNSNPDGMALFRRSFSIQKGHRVRILAIGGSSTYGMGVEEKETWPAWLQSRLDADFPGSFEVINLGRLGGHLEEFILNYRATSRIYVPRDKWIDSPANRPTEAQLASWGWKDLHPDALIVAPVAADTAPDYLYRSRKNVLARWADKFMDDFHGTWVGEKLALSHYIIHALTDLSLKNRNTAEVDLPTLEQTYETNLSRFLQLWEGTPIYVFGLPLLFNQDDSEKDAKKAAVVWNLPETEILHELQYMPLLETLEARVRNRAGQNRSIRSKELGKEIKNLPFPSRLKLYHDSIHLRGDGYRQVVEEMYGFLRDDFSRLATPQLIKK